MSHRGLRERALRYTSLGLVFVFSTSLGVPYLHAAESAPSTVAATNATMALTAKKSLSSLWLAWVKNGGTSTTKPDRAFAQDFFQKNGATPQQASTLVNNAQAEGQLIGALPSSQTGIKGMFNKLFGLKQAEPAAAGAAAQVAEKATLATRIKTAVDKIRGKTTTSTVAPANATQTSSTAASATAPKTIQGAIQNVGEQVKAGVDKVKLIGARGTADATAAISTGYLTSVDAFNLKQFYKIPISQNASIKIQGGSNYTTKFVSNSALGFDVVNQQVKSSINAVDAISKNEALLKISKLQTQAGTAEVTTSGLGNVVSKIKSSLTNLKDKVMGTSGPNAPKDAGPKLTQLDMQSNMLEHAQALNQVEQSINTRIQKLTTDAARLQRPAPTQEIADLKAAMKDVQSQKSEVMRRLDGKNGPGGQSVIKSGVQWALWSVGITASINVIKQVVGGEKVDFKKALSFMGDPSFWGGTAGGFLGSMVVSRLASAIIPGGGIFMSVLPGFLGAALGFEAGSGLFGGGSGDIMGTVGQSIASAGGYALAASLLGGGMFGPLLGALGAGVLFNIIWSKLRGTNGPPGDGLDLPPPTLDPNLDINALNTMGPAELSLMPGAEADAVPTSANMSELMNTMQIEYKDYINFLKEGKVADAREAYQRYSSVKTNLDTARQSAIAAQ